MASPSHRNGDDSLLHSRCNGAAPMQSVTMLRGSIPFEVNRPGDLSTGKNFFTDSL